MSELRFQWAFREMQFKFAARTSRNTLQSKPSWFIKLTDENGNSGWGECSLIPGLSIDNVEKIEAQLRSWQGSLSRKMLEDAALAELPALRFALETAFQSLDANGFDLYPSAFTANEKGIDINGLIWMDDTSGMLEQINDRIAEGFHIIKMKVGALDHAEEIKMLETFRKRYPAHRFELRVDANGAFTPENALQRLNELAQYEIHSIEQPIKAGQAREMAQLCEESPISIALDEELIYTPPNAALLDQIRPDYLILKPSLLGGLAVAEQWRLLAQERGIGWWATSALESNIGLNAIAQWCAISGNPLPQGLGTGKLFTNNIHSPLEVRDAQLHYRRSEWELSDLVLHG